MCHQLKNSRAQVLDGDRRKQLLSSSAHPCLSQPNPQDAASEMGATPSKYEHAMQAAVRNTTAKWLNIWDKPLRLGDVVKLSPNGDLVKIGSVETLIPDADQQAVWKACVRAWMKR